MVSVCLSSCNTYHLTWVSLTLDVGYLFTAAPAKHSCCSLRHRTLIPSPVTSTTWWCFCFGSVSAFFLELFLRWSPVAYWVPTDLGSSSFSVLSFYLLILFMRFSRQEYWRGLPFPSPADHVLLELSTMTLPSWMALYSMVHTFIDKGIFLKDAKIVHKQKEELWK